MTQTSSASIEKLQGFEEFVHAVMQDWQLPGLAIAIVKDGEVILAQGFGKRNISEDLPVTSNTLFAIGSCTKAFTATIVGMLVDEGKLAWDTPIKQYLPTFKLHDPIATEHATLRDLLSHRTGLPRHDLAWYGSPATRQELFERLPYLEPTKEFRSTWQYQNLMYMTVGYLIEQIVGKSWEEVVKERILQPLGMNDSNTDVHATQQTNDFAMPYKENKENVEETNFYEQWAVGPAGAINSNVNDMSKWLLVQFNKGKYGEQQLISEAQFEQIHTPHMVMPGPTAVFTKLEPHDKMKACEHTLTIYDGVFCTRLIRENHEQKSSRHSTFHEPRLSVISS